MVDHTYQELFVSATKGAFPGTAVKEIADRELSQLVLIKKVIILIQVFHLFIGFKSITIDRCLSKLYIGSY